MRFSSRLSRLTSSPSANLDSCRGWGEQDALVRHDGHAAQHHAHVAGSSGTRGACRRRSAHAWHAGREAAACGSAAVACLREVDHHIVGQARAHAAGNALQLGQAAVQRGLAALKAGADAAAAARLLAAHAKASGAALQRMVRRRGSAPATAAWRRGQGLPRQPLCSCACCGAPAVAAGPWFD